MRVSSEHDFSLDEAIQSFELMLDRHDGSASIDIEDFLPRRDHPLFYETLVELIRVDMELGWSHGRAQSLNDYLIRFPLLREQLQWLQPICFEEYRQRLLAGERVAASFYHDLYGIDIDEWPPESLSLPKASERVDQPAIGDSQDPQDGLLNVGKHFLGFELIRELGRGSFARVFLARQVSLSNRLVALKVTRDHFSDAEILARLQHTNIIPVYSVHRDRDFEAICMPYLGSVTIRHLLELIRSQKSVPVSAKFVCDTVQDEQEKTVRSFAEPTQADNDPTFQTLKKELNPDSLATRLHSLSGLSYTQSVLLLAKKIASGLAYAHEHGIVHRDLKPANILIADDGEPLILDFNLSQDSSPLSITRQQLVGGTLPYMAPEQLVSLEQKSRDDSDPRSDLYSFGIILYEMLIGKSPFPIRTGEVHQTIALALHDRRLGPTPIDSKLPSITPAVRSIIDKCLAWKPEERYQSADQLVVDLNCQLSNLPLVTARNRSWIERGRKWMRRHPRLVSASGIITMAATLLMLLGGVLLVRNEQLLRYQAQSVWVSFQQKLRQAELKSTRSPLGDAARLDEAVAACDHALSVLSIDSDPQWRTSPIIKRLDPTQQQQLAQKAAELYFLKATCLGLKADLPGDRERRSGLLAVAQQYNLTAKSLVPQSDLDTALERQLRWLKDDATPIETTGRSEDIHKLPFRALCERACLLSAQRRFRESTDWWDAAVTRDPKSLWGWYGLGYALQQTKQFARAAECYSVCLALDPQQSCWYFDRGVIRILTGDYELAANDLRHAATLDPSDAETHLNLAIASIELNHHDDAIGHVEQTLLLGLKDPQVYLLLARVKSALGEADAAGQARLLAQKCSPMRAESWVSRGVSKASTDPSGALADFDKALLLDAYLYEAYESKASVLAEALGNTQAAIEVFDEAVHRFPEMGECRALRGVLHSRLQHRNQAASDATSALALSSSPAVGYCVAGIYANLSIESKDYGRDAIGLLASALKAGYGADLLETDSDLAPIRDSPEFKRLLGATKVYETISAE